MVLYKVSVTPKTALTGGSDGAESLNIEPVSCANIKQWIYWPQRCPCCGGESNAYTDIRWAQRRFGETVAGETWYSIRVPYCQTCLDHAKVAANAPRTGLRAGLLVSLALFVPAMVIFFRKPFSVVTFLAVLTASVGGGCLQVAASYRFHNSKARSMLRQGCSSRYAAVSAGESQGSVHTFLFRSREYAQDFARMNAAEVTGQEV